MTARGTPRPETIRLAWWSPRAFPLLLATFIGPVLVFTPGGRSPYWLLLSVAFLGHFVFRLLAPYVVLGEHWMVVPAEGFWNIARSPWPGAAMIEEADRAEGRTVRVANVASWQDSGGEIRLRLKDGAERKFSLHGLRGRDKRRVRDYLVEKLGG